MSDSSDIEIKSTLPKKLTKKIPKSPSEYVLKENEEPKKLSTKFMVHQALTELKSRKGTSLYAIKKFIQEKFNVDVEKINYIIKKVIKAGVEAGTIVQTKGLGASGSFKLVVGKDKVEKKKAKTKKLLENANKQHEDKPKKSTKRKAEGKTNKNEKKAKKKDNSESNIKVIKKNTKSNENKEDTKKDNLDTKVKGTKKKSKTNINKEDKTKKSKAGKLAKGMQTPSKKRAAMMKRKSIGSIIKPPKNEAKGKG